MIKTRVRADDNSAIDVKMRMSLLAAFQVGAALSSESSSGADSSIATESFRESSGSGLFVEGGCAGSSWAGVDVAIVSIEREYLQQNRARLRSKNGHRGV